MIVSNNYFGCYYYEYHNQYTYTKNLKKRELCYQTLTLKEQSISCILISITDPSDY